MIGFKQIEFFDHTGLRLMMRQIVNVTSALFGTVSAQNGNPRWASVSLKLLW